MLEPLGNRVIILPDETNTNEFGEGVSAGGIITQTAAEVDDDRGITSVGTIIDFGPSAWLDPILGGKPWVDKGDKVIFAKYSGKFVTDPADGKEYVVVNDDAIQVRVG